MSNNTEIVSANTFAGWTLGGWFFAILFSAIGFVNTLWGNDPGFGIFIILLSLTYVPPLNKIFREKTGRSIPVVVKILLGLFILWAALGVGELPDKIDMMLDDLSI